MEKFGTQLTLRPRVDREATVTVRMNEYSVPARFIGRKLQVLFGTTEVVVFDGRTEVARHPRLFGEFADTPAGERATQPEGAG